MHRTILAGFFLLLTGLFKAHPACGGQGVGLSDFFDWDTQRPAVGAVEPGRAATDLSARLEVQVRFASPVEESTLVAANLRVQGSANGEVTTGISYYPEPLLLVLRPERVFQLGETVSVTLAADIEDAFGNALDGNHNGRADGSPADYVWSFTIGEHTPSLVIENIETNLPPPAGKIRVNFTSEDPDQNFLTTTAWQFSRDGLNWLDIGEEEIQENDLLAPGTHGLVWDTQAGAHHLGGIEAPQVWFRMQVADGVFSSSYATSQPFAVDNNAPPSVQLTKVSEPHTAEVLLACTIADAEGDSVYLNIMYSLDEGGSWKKAAVEGDTLVLPGTSRLQWKAREDLGAYLGEAWVQVVPSDLDKGRGDILILSLQMPLGDAAPADSLDGWIDGKDLPAFALAWNDQDLRFDIGPATGTVPNLQPQPDGWVDFEDLAVFVLMWNWSAEQQRGKAARLAALLPGTDSHMRWNDEEMPLFSPGEIVPLTLRLPDQPSVMVLHLEWSYNPEHLSWHGVQTLEALGDNADHLLVLSWVDETEGRVIVDVARLGGTPLGVDGTQPLLQVSWSARTELSEKSLTIRGRVWDGQGMLQMSEQTVLQLNSRPAFPETYALHPSFPNPFNAQTTIRYDLPEAGMVRLTMYDMLGRVVRRLVEGRQAGGYHHMSWDSRDEADRPVAGGVYLCRLQVEALASSPVNSGSLESQSAGGGSGTYSETRKMLLLR